MEKLALTNRLVDAETKNDDLALNLAHLEKAMRDSERRAENLLKQNEDQLDATERKHQAQVSAQ